MTSLASRKFRLEFFSTGNLERNLWGALTRQSPYTNLYQDPDWAIINEEFGLEQSVFAVATQPDSRMAGIRVWKSRTRIGRFFETAGGPLYNEGSGTLANDFLESVVHNLRRGTVGGNFLFSPFFSPEKRTMFDRINRDRVTFLIDLTRSEDELWNRLDKSARWGIRTADRKGVSVQVADELEAWLQFQRIQLRESGRKGYSHLALSEEITRRIYEILRPKGMCVLLAASVDGRLVAGSLLYAAPQTLHWFRNASDPQYLDRQPNDCLLWNAIRLGKKRAIRFLDLFGAPRASTGKPSGIYLFKSKWGGREILNPVYTFGRAYSFASGLYNSSQIIGHLFAKTNALLLGF